MRQELLRDESYKRFNNYSIMYKSIIFCKHWRKIGTVIGESGEKMQVFI